MYADAKAHQCALPAVDVVITPTVKAVIEAASKLELPVVTQSSFGSDERYAGKSLPNDHRQAIAAGCVNVARHVHDLAGMCGATLFMSSDHGALQNISGID